MGRVADFFREQSITLDGQKKQKMLSLDREFEDMKTERDTLKTQNLHLQAKVNPLEREVERLQKQIQKETASVHNLEADEIGLLKFIGNAVSCTSREVKDGTGMHSVQVEHLLGQLLRSGYIAQDKSVSFIGALYSLSDEGNAYLVKNKLIPLIQAATVEQPTNPNNYPCDHCGSTRLKRIGTRPNKYFEEVGIKDAIFLCLDCRKESAIEQKP